MFSWRMIRISNLLTTLTDKDNFFYAFFCPKKNVWQLLDLNIWLNIGIDSYSSVFAVSISACHTKLQSHLLSTRAARKHLSSKPTVDLILKGSEILRQNCDLF